MLRILTAHPEEHEVVVSAMAVVAPDPRRLDQSQTTGRRRVPHNGESGPQRETREETNPVPAKNSIRVELSTFKQGSANQ